MSTHEHHAKQLRRVLDRSARTLLTNTTGIDGDSLGALMAMGSALDQLGKDWFAYVPEDVPEMFEYLVKRRPPMRELDSSVHSFGAVIVFDTGDIRRTPLLEELKKRDRDALTVVNIDHHPTVTVHDGDEVIDLNIVDPQASSTTEMLVGLFEALDVRIDATMATSLLTGILTDTTHFANPNTTQETIAVAAKLMAKGADHRTITKNTMRNKSLGTLKLWGRALSRLAYNPSSGVVSTVVTLKDIEECHTDADATTGIANFLTTLAEGKVALVLQEEPNGIVKGSFRTTSEVNVAEMAKKFGGGGHPKAAGFKVKGKLVETGLGWAVEKLSG